MFSAHSFPHKVSGASRNRTLGVSSTCDKLWNNNGDERRLSDSTGDAGVTEPASSNKGSRASTAESTVAPTSERARLGELALIFLRLGATAFGGPVAHIAMMRREFVQRRKWISDQRFVDLIGIVNLVPGPNSTEIAIYLGYLRAGWPGLVIAGVCFIGPAMVIVMALAWAYVTFGALPQTAWLLYGILPVVIAIIVQALWGLGRTVVRNRIIALWALVIVVLYLLGVDDLLLLFGGAILYAVAVGGWRAMRQRRATLSLLLPLLPGASGGAAATATTFASARPRQRAFQPPDALSDVPQNRRAALWQWVRLAGFPAYRLRTGSSLAD